MYSSTTSSTSALDGGFVASATPRAALPLGERPVTHCVGGIVGPRAGLDRYGKFRPPAGI
jgi:hypothetical protein